MIKIPYTRGIFCNRTLNLRAIPVIGYDMDYTLVHYKVEAWEGLAYQYIKKYLKKDGWPVDDLVFDPSIFIRGLVIDKELGNIVKVNRFGYVKAAYHGTQRLQFEKMRDVYSRTIVDLADTRYAFLNTLFSISEACIFSQLVDLLDHGKITGVLNYADLAQRIRTVLDQAHLEGELKDEIMANPEQFVEVDPELPLTLLDQKHANKKLLLITNSGWKYSKFMMSYICDRYLPKGMDWRDLFDLIVVSARKPSFFTDKPPMFEIVDNDDGLLKPVIGEIKKNGCYLGGNASMIEKYLGVSGEEILYVGDHLFCDVSISKEVLRWRTALIIRELEEELQAIENAREDHRQIRKMMKEKEALEGQIRHQQLILQRREKKYAGKIKENPTDIKSELRKLRDDLHELDVQISDLNVRDSKRFNTNWSYLMRTGNDKSKFTRQVERYADIYTSRVSNMLYYTPFMYFRSPRGSIPHDPVFYPEDLKEQGMKAYTKEQVRELDRIAIEEYQIPSIVLMENAGAGAARIIVREIGTQKSVAIFCGKGNNGGDGFVIARHLHNNGIEVHVFFLGETAQVSADSDPGINLRILHNMKIPIIEIHDVHSLNEYKSAWQNCDYLVDAIFGTGLCREISGNLHAIMSEIKSWNKKNIAIDTPSGLDGNTGEIHGITLPAELTITFALPKKGFFIKDGPNVTGNIEVVDISIPKELVEKLQEFIYMKILICDAFDSSLPEKLAAYGEVFSDMERLAEANIALIRSKTKCTKEWIDKAPELKMIIRGGVGLDNVDCDYAQQKGIRVDNTPEASSIAVAEMAFAMMIAMPNQIIKAHNGMMAGEWLKKQCKRTELYGKTLGLIGYGRIAKELAKRARAFSMKVVAYKRTPVVCEFAEMKSLDEVLTQSDFISLHTPLNDASRNLINGEAIAKMKNGVYVINTARGECVVEKDVATALNSGHISGYAADVWETEPPKDRTLVETKNCLASPHIASSSAENLKRIGEIIEQKISAFVS